MKYYEWPRQNFKQLKNEIPSVVMMPGNVNLRRVRQKPGRQNVADRAALRGHRQRHCPTSPTFSRQKIRRWLRMEVVERAVTDVGQLRDDVGQDGAAVVAAAARTVVVI